MRATPSAARRIIVLAAALVLLGTTGLAVAGVGDYEVLDRTKVYHGNCLLFQRPCEVAADRVFQNIPAYQEILRRGLTEKDPQYHLLMKKASARFADAVKKMVAQQGHDLVAETGAVRVVREGADPVPDRTNDVIQSLD
jgi:hypothetical protein